MEENKPKKIVKMSDVLPPPSRAEPVISAEEPERIEAEKFELKTEPPLEIASITPKEGTEADDQISLSRHEGINEEERIFPKNLFISKPLKNKKRILLAGGIICFIVLSVIFYVTLSKAEIIIKPKTEIMQFQTELNIDKNVAFIDLDNNKIPGQLFYVEQEEEREFLTTQEREVKEKAKGVITVYNQYSSAPQTLVKGTRFISEKGQMFRTAQTIIIPGAKVEEGQIIPSTLDVEVEAAEPGKEYNIEPSSFTIPGFEGTAKYTGFYGKSNQSMSGGIVGRVKVASAEDIQGAKDILSVELKERAKKELEKKIPSNLKILQDTILLEVLDSSSDIEAEQPAEKFKVAVKVAAKSLGFNEGDAASLINDNLKGKIPEDKIMMPNSMEINYKVVGVNLEKGTAKLTCQVKKTIAWKIDVEKIRKDLSGKSEVEVRQYLASRSEIESAKVIFWPFWVKKIPINEKKVKIKVD